MTAILTTIQHQGPLNTTYHIMLPPSYSDHDPLPPPSFDPLSMMLSQFSIVKRFACFLTTGDLIQLSRTSTTVRETLLQSPEYWSELLALTSLVCSENTHIKGENVKNCVICSMPVCETCIVKSDFHGTSGTFLNRIRTFCDSCWSATNFSHPPNSPHTSAPPLCLCVAKDGWLCSHCRSTERTELLENKYTCATDGCDEPHGNSEKQRVCTWCRLPLPPAWRPVTAEQIPNPGAPGGGEPIEEEAPGYDEGSSNASGRRTSDAVYSSMDKVKIAGWEQMNDEERSDYQKAWLAKGARESARAGRVVRGGSRDDSGEGSSAAPAADGDEAPSFDEALNDGEVGEASPSAEAQEALGKMKLKGADNSGGSS
ncbi:hypothetical protein DFP73DRAFT_33238 [Morchella snyderi]|nr:hypothetical protein DFP73DRAFT_33238 [Morchella snyderi]